MVVQAPPPTGYLEIERVLRLLALGESDLWIAGQAARCRSPGGGGGGHAAGPGPAAASPGRARDHAAAAGGSTQRPGARLVSQRRPVSLAGPGFHLRGYPDRKVPAKAAYFLHINAATR